MKSSRPKSDPAQPAVGPPPAAQNLDRPATLEVDLEAVDLEGVYERQQRWPELVELLLEQAENPGSSEGRAHALTKAAALFETQLRDPEGAWVALTEAVKSAANPRRVANLDRLAASLRRREELGAVLELAAQQADSYSAAAAAYMGLAQWHRSRQSWEPAAQCAERVLSFDPTAVEAMALHKDAREHLQRTSGVAPAVTAQPNSVAEQTRAALRVANALHTQGRLEEASQTLERARNQDPGCEALYDELAQLYGARGCWHEFIDNCWDHAAVTADEGVRARLAFEAGRVLQNRLGQGEAAQAAYAEALTHDPKHLNARRGLIGVFRNRGDLGALAENLWELAELSDDREEKLACWSEAAALLRDSLGESARATLVEARIMALDPLYETPAARLIEAAAQAQNWAEVKRLGTEVLRLTDPSPAFFVARLAQAHLHLGSASEAMPLFHRADALAAGGLSWRIDWIAALAQTGRLAHAANVARQILARQSLEPSQRRQVHTTLAEAYLRSGQPRSAVSEFKFALAAAPGWGPALSGLAQAHHQMGQVHEGIAWRWSAFDHATTESEKVEHVLQILRWIREQGSGLADAQTVLEHAVAQLPASQALWHTLLDVYVEAKNWSGAVDVHTRLAKQEQTGPGTTHWLAAAAILEQQLGDNTGAVTCLEAALDGDPSNVEAIHRIEALLARAQDHAAYERHLRRRLARLNEAGEHVDTSPQEVQVWQQLVRLYQGPLTDPHRATMALEVLAQLTGTTGSKQALAAAYDTAGSEGRERSQRLRLELLAQARSPAEMIEPLRGLFHSFESSHDGPRASHALAALVRIGQASPTEQNLYAAEAARPFTPPAATIGDSAWVEAVYHPDENAAVSAIMAHAATAAAMRAQRPAKAWGLPAKWPRGFESELASQRHVMRLQHVATLLGANLPPLAHKPDYPGFADVIVVSGMRRPLWTVVLGQAFFTPRPDRAFACMAANLVCRLRPEHLVTWPNVAPTPGDLESILQASERLAGLPLNVPTTPALQARVEPWCASLLQTLSQGELQALQTAAAALPSQGRASDWLRGVAFTTRRAALLLSHDLISALTEEQPERLGNVNISAFEALRDLMVWSLSDAYKRLTRHMG